MRSSLRYLVSLVVGLVVAGVTVSVANTPGSLPVAIAPLYAATTALVLRHRDGWKRLFRFGNQRWSDRKRGALGGGIGALSFSLLLSLSVPAGITGIGLMLFGQALTVADYESLPE
ncbi:hypothetical protein [Haloferax sp. ATB1]|uniref:hypothetical protein n=1 Tax=Haloferax sp. ATB1 TaxID=1508454 RepID=UPI0005B1D3A5|nr:hypothetical protein [Haloferax sp. ATB1]